jgi:predicted transcriptional regulator
MSSTRPQNASDVSPPDTVQPDGDDPDQTLDASILDTIGDEHTTRIINALSGGAKTAPALASVTGASRPTVYRRLGTLEEAGLVDSSLTIDADGHHKKQYTLGATSLTVDLTNQLAVTAE